MYELEELVTNIQMKIEDVEKKIRDVKYNITILKEMLEHIAELPSDIMPPINESVTRLVQAILEEQSYINDPESVLVQLKNAYRIIANDLISFVLVPKVRECESDITRFHDSILEVTRIIKKYGKPSIALQEILNEIIRDKDPCEAYRQLNEQSTEYLYKLDEYVTSISTLATQFFEHDKNNEPFTRMILDELSSSKNLHELLQYITNLEDIKEKLHFLCNEYKTHRNLISCIESVFHASFKTPSTQILYNNILSKLNTLKETINSIHNVIRTGGLSLKRTSNLLSEYQHIIDTTLSETRKLIDKYRKNTVRFLERINKNIATQVDIKINELNIESLINLKNIIKILSEVDKIIEEQLEKQLQPDTREVLKKILELVSEKDTHELRLEWIIKHIDRDPSKLKALIEICESGIIECVVRA